MSFSDNDRSWGLDDLNLRCEVGFERKFQLAPFCLIRRDEPNPEYFGLVLQENEQTANKPNEICILPTKTCTFISCWMHS
jgi:hypothetical protein